MFSLFDRGYAQDCEGVSRRELLKIGALGVGGLTLPGLLRVQAAAEEAGIPVTGKSVVVLFLQGGPTHVETFDPKMTAPQEYRAMFGEVATKIPGVTFGSHFSQLAALADKMSIVRSYRHGISSHGPASEHVAAGGNPTGATMGTLYSRIAGTSNPRTGLPSNVLITPKAMGERYKRLGSNSARVTSVGTLPPAFKTFDPSGGGAILENMKLKLDQTRLDDRRSLLGQLDAIKREIDNGGLLDGADKFQQQAFQVILGGASEAFDISKEDPRTVARYDTGQYEIPPKLKKKKRNVPRQSPIALGRQMLLARRLVESGVRFVTVTSAGWDMHGNAFGVNDGMPLLGPSVDKAASAFIEDCHQRGMLDDVLLVITGEFGRTPKINKKGGRDHWGNLCTLAFAGGGLKSGTVVGASDKKVSVPAADPVTSENLRATIMRTLFDIGELRIARGIPSQILKTVTDGEPIRQLV